MGHSATNVLVHFIFSTRHRAPQISPEIEADLHAYLGGIVRELGGVALCVNGMGDHVHLLHERWPQRKSFGWQTNYGAFSVSESGQNAVREYIQHQQQPHAKRSFKEEFVVFLQKNHIAIDGKHLWS